MHLGGLECCGQGVLGEHVVDGVVDQDDVEGDSQPDVPHVAQVVGDGGVEFLGEGQHFRG